ncbi:MAG: leucine-rich repeat protein [Oscillospiraceae bacterium]|nr:leucine-rich repeat protein [Oscillospiraceae bacterium]
MHIRKCLSVLTAVSMLLMNAPVTAFAADTAPLTTVMVGAGNAEELYEIETLDVIPGEVTMDPGEELTFRVKIHAAEGLKFENPMLSHSTGSPNPFSISCSRGEFSSDMTEATYTYTLKAREPGNAKVMIEIPDVLSVVDESGASTHLPNIIVGSLSLHVTGEATEAATDPTEATTEPTEAVTDPTEATSGSEIGKICKLRITVVDAETGDPLPGVTIQHPDGVWESDGTVFDGTYTFNGTDTMYVYGVPSGYSNPKYDIFADYGSYRITHAEDIDVTFRIPHEGETLDPEETFKPVLDMFRKNVSEGWVNFDVKTAEGFVLSEDLDTVSPLWLTDLKDKTPDEVGYHYRHGLLYIGAADRKGSNYSPYAYDVYGYHDGKIIHICSSGESHLYDGNFDELRKEGNDWLTIRYNWANGKPVPEFALRYDAMKDMDWKAEITVDEDGSYVYDWELTNWDYATPEFDLTMLSGVETPPETTEPPTDPGFEPGVKPTWTVDPQEAYGDLIRSYRSFTSCHWVNTGTEHASGILNTNDLKKVSTFWTEYYSDWDSTNTGYVITDLNADNIPELAVCVMRSETMNFRYRHNMGEILGLYTYYDGKVVNLAATGGHCFINFKEGELVAIEDNEVVTAYVLKDGALVAAPELDEQAASIDKNNDHVDSFSNVTIDGVTYQLFSDHAAVVASSSDIPADVVLPQTVEGQPLTVIENEAFLGCGSLETIVIPEGVVRIGNSTDFDTDTPVTGEPPFSLCASLRKVVLPATATQLGEGLFYACTSLEEINIPHGVDKLRDSDALLTYGWRSVGFFDGCSSLKNVTLPDSVSELGTYAFYNCGALETLTVLNDECKFAAASSVTSAADDLTPTEPFKFDGTILGHTGSTAEAFAKENGCQFKALDEPTGYDITGDSLQDITLRPNESFTYTMTMQTNDGGTFRLVQNGKDALPPVGIGQHIDSGTEAIYSELRWEVTEISADGTQLRLDITVTAKDYGTGEVSFDLDTDEAGEDRYFIVYVDADGNETPVTKISPGSFELTVEGDPVETDPELLYKDIIDYFRENIAEEWANYGDAGDTTYGIVNDEKTGYVSSLWLTTLRNEAYDNVGYGFADINGDGVQELLVGILYSDSEFGKENNASTIIDAYTWYNGRIIHLCSGGARVNYDLGQNGILEDAADGAVVQLTTRYELKDGALVPVECWKNDETNEELPYAYSDKPVLMDPDGDSYYEFTDWTESSEENQLNAKTKSFTIVPFESKTNLLFGDVNGDGTVNASDAAVVLIAAASIGATNESNLTYAQEQAANVNGDNAINASDAAIILQYAAALGANAFTGTLQEYLQSKG